ncbi:hypothetical protein [Legionella norrlandica]|nr:hypothetical protein [Legionella norrlandica]
MLKPRNPVTYMPNTGQHRYIISRSTFEKIQNYQNALIIGAVKPGNRLLAEINYFLAEGKTEYDPDKPLTSQDLAQLRKLSPAEFMQLVMNTRLPKIFAESQATIGEGKMWNKDEYEILGNICSVLRGVEVYDNGKYGATGTGDGRYKDNPPKINLLCIPGAILQPPNTMDREKILSQADGRDVLDERKFKDFYKDRLRTVFQEANDQAKEKGKKAFITVPGIGNGAFAGEFRGQTIGLLNDTLKELLEENPQWKNIGGIWLDGYSSTVCQDNQIGDTKLRVRNTGSGSNGSHVLQSGKPYSDLGQMSKAEDFAESPEEAIEFANCERFKIFAWDHFSYEGNDWVGGSRMTDEANMAACNGLGVMSGFPGQYRNENPEIDGPPKAYYPPEGYRTWEQLFYSNNLKQSIADRLFVFDNGNFVQLKTNNAAKKELFEQVRSDLASSTSLDGVHKKLCTQILTAALDPYNEHNPMFLGLLTTNLPKNDRVSYAKKTQNMIEAFENELVKRVEQSDIKNTDDVIARINLCFDAIRHQIKKIIENNFLKIKSSYQYGQNNQSRNHASPVTYSGPNEQYKNKTGDVLKREILESFKEKIAECSTDKELNKLVKLLNASDEYRILETPQDTFSKITGKKTSSIKAFETMVSDAKKEIKKLKLNPSSGNTATKTVSFKEQRKAITKGDEEELRGSQENRFS